MIHKSFKVKIKPTEEQLVKFYRNWKGYVKAYNLAVEVQIAHFDSESIRRDRGEKSQGFFLHKYAVAKDFWTPYKKTLNKKFIYGVSSVTTKQGLFDACSACERFFENSKGKPAIREHSKYNEKYCSPEAKKGGKPYLFINKEGQPVYSLYYRTGGPRFKRLFDNPCFPISLDRFSVSDKLVFVSGLDGSLNRGNLDQITLVERNRIPFSSTEPLKYSNPRISFDGVDWWISVGVELPEVQYELHKGMTMGVDLGVADDSLTITDSGEKFRNHLSLDNYKKAQEKSDRLQSVLDKKEKRIRKLNGGKFVNSNSYRKLKRKCDKARIHLNDIKKYNRHLASHNIVKENPELIGLETLDIEAMTSNLAKTKDKTNKEWQKWHRRILETGMYEVQRQIEYKAKWRGIKVQKIDQFFPSSKTCSNCGYVNHDLILDDRYWTCPQCGTHHDRDVNAAINIRNEAIRCHENGIEVQKKRKTKIKKKEMI